MENLTRTLKFVSEEGFFFHSSVMLLSFLKAIGAQSVFRTGHISCYASALTHPTSGSCSSKARVVSAFQKQSRNRDKSSID